MIAPDTQLCPAIEINISCDGWPTENVLTKMSQSAVSAAISIAGLKFPADAVLSMLFSDDAELGALNARFRNIDEPTNVLSFPGSDILPGEKAALIVGDLAFALPTIEKEALLENKKFDHHLCHLIIHGFLHLFGYDHISDEDAMIMESIETSALALLGIKDPYLEQ